MTHLNWPELMPFGQAVGWTLLHSLWQIALVGFILRLLLWLIPQKQSDARYAVLMAGLLVPLVWAGYTFSGQWAILAEAPVQAIELTTVTATTAIPDNPAFHGGPLSGTQAGDAALPAGISRWQYQLARLESLLSLHLFWIAIVWYLGVLVLSVFMLVGFYQIHRLRTQNVRLPEPEWRERFDALAKKMGIRKPLSFMISASISEPLTFHFFRPVVLAPVGLFTGLSRQQVEVLLLHELAHIRRYDFLANIFQSVIEVLFFYHPTVWWISGKLREVREHCCDDLVLGVQDQPMLYAEALTHLQLFHHPRKTKLAMYANGKKGNFSTRILRLFGQYEGQARSLRGSLIGLLVLVCLVFQGFFTAVPQLEAGIDTQLEISSETAPGLHDPAFVQNAAPTVRTDSPCGDLLRAVKAGDLQLARKILQSDSTNPNCSYFKDGEPRSSLVAAARLGNLEMVKLLVEAKADVEFYARGDESPLMAAAAYGHLEIVEYLITQGAQVNLKISGNGTALLMAARNGHLPVVRYLIGRGANINDKVSGDGTALICAVRDGRYDVAKLLLENGADPFQVSPGDEYAMYHARMNSDQKMIQLLKKYEER